MNLKRHRKETNMNRSTIYECTQLRCYDSLLEITTKYVDIGNTFLLPIINLFSLVSNLICIKVLTSNKLKTNIFRLMLFGTISDFIFAIVCISIPFIRCGTFCDWSFSYAAKTFELYVYLVITNSCLLFSLLINIYQAISKYYSFSHKIKTSNNSSKKERNIVFLFFIVSISINIIVYAIPRDIELVGYLSVKLNETISLIPLYNVENNSIEKKNISIEWILFIITILKGVVLISVLLILNILVFAKLKKYIAKRKIKFFNGNIVIL